MRRIRIAASEGLAALAALAVAQAATAQSELAPRAAPNAVVNEAPLEAADPDAAPTAAAEPLLAMIAAGAALDPDEADRLLRASYDVHPTPTTRSRAFGLAAAAASRAGRHDQALAWTDWAIAEAERAPERDVLLAEQLAAAVEVALAAGNAVLARSYARRAGGYAAGFRDEGERRGVAYDALALFCPDVIESGYVRVAATVDPGAGLLGVPAARCDYAAFRDDGGLSIHAVRSRMDPRARTEGVIEQGLDGREVERRRAVARRLWSLQTVVTPLVFEDLGEVRLGYARHSRRGVDDVAAFAYATAARGDVFYSGAASGRVWDWPPTDLGWRAETGLRAALTAGRAAEKP